MSHFDYDTLLDPTGWSKVFKQSKIIGIKSLKVIKNSDCSGEAMLYLKNMLIVLLISREHHI